MRRVLGLLMVLLALTMFTTLAQDVSGEAPESVTIAGTVQSVLGCPGDWQPECEATFLTYNEEYDLWIGEFELPAGEYEYKAAINGAWDINYGDNAEPGGENIPLTVAEDATVTFIFDNKSGWVTDDINSVIASVPGNFQSEVGCMDDWDASCLRTWLQDPDGDGIYVYETASIPAGDWEAKVAIDGAWDENYGVDGVADGENIPFTVPEGGALVTFSYDTATNIMDITTGDMPEIVEAEDTETQMDAEVSDAPTLPETGLDMPEMVVIPGTIQSVVGCDSDWQPDCDATALTYDENNDIWRGSFDIPAGEYEYKVAINGTWDINFGLNAAPGGPNIPLVLEEDTTVEFLFDAKTGWVTDDVNTIIANVPGNFQSEVGCVDTNGNGGDWEPVCLRTWLQDTDGDGVYVYATSSIPAGNFEAKVAVDESWGENYGVGGAPDGANIAFTVPEDNVLVTFIWDSVSKEMTIDVSSDIVIEGNLGFRAAHWLTQDTLAWDVDVIEDAEYHLHYSATASLELTGEGIIGGESIPLIPQDDPLSVELAAEFPYVAGFSVFTIDAENLDLVPEILRGQFAVSATNAEGAPIDATGIQIPGVLDDLYSYNGELGAVLDNDAVPTLQVWAPTAQNVRLHLFDDSTIEDSTVYDMTRDDESGVWRVEGEADWMNKYYVYEVQVFAPSTLAIETNFVTDPYSFSLSMNSQRSQIVDLSDPALLPEGWNALDKPALEAPEDIIVYELHIRDFSIYDESVPEDLRGTYMAFTLSDSNGVQHLERLSEAGLTHLHLLPSFDIATINENPDERIEPDPEVLASFPPDSEEQQALIMPIRDEDGFNWGYDPYHYTVPEGSYATDPDGPQRILEFRQMVQALNEMGLRVVVDVVYNHTNAEGQSPRSVLDRIVPGYYHRLDAQTGNVLTTSCCPNTATEHTMMEKLMVDSVVTWATAYKIDGFRFDLMGSHMLDDMQAVLDAINELTIEDDGVDGDSIYVYGEGWTRPDTDNNQRGIPATQTTIGGTGIGVFNDRLRDAVRGGSPFDGRQHQGWISDLFFNPNGITPGDDTAQLEQLMLFADQIRVGLAGNLAGYTFVGANGDTVTGADVPYGGTSAGYTLDPQENIIYISKHDNETLWDILMYKDLDDVSLAEYVRMHNLGHSIVMFSQGIPFFHAGDDLLRSKSLDRNSYNSGDWFNRIDWTYQINNFGVGLPPAPDNESRWDIMQPLLANEDLYVTPDHIESARLHFLELLEIRSDVRLFRLQTADQVDEMLQFLNTGTDQIPGLIVMSLTDNSDFDPQYEQVVVLFNAQPAAVAFTADELAATNLTLHPVQANSFDEVVSSATFDAETGTFNIPARTTAVFVVTQE